jgi:alanyl-tRNA synthetase
MALFGEKYGDEVRVVAMGASDDPAARNAYSIELCGGTHVGRTGDIGLFRITSEGAVSAGIRRIEALAGASAIAAVEEEARLLAQAAAALRAPVAELPARILALQEDKRKLERQVSELQKKLAMGSAANEVEEIGGVKFSGRNVGEISAKDLKSVAQAVLQEQGGGVTANVAVSGGKVSIVVGVSPELTEKFDAVALVRAAASAVGGRGGGGNRGMAQAGGPDGENWQAAIDAVKAVLA